MKAVLSFVRAHLNWFAFGALAIACVYEATR